MSLASNLVRYNRFFKTTKTKFNKKREKKDQSDKNCQKVVEKNGDM